MEETRVVTCFLRNRSEVLLLRRSEGVGSYPGRWGGVAGHAEDDPDQAARKEVAAETGLLDACRLARTGVTFEFEDSDLETRWVVHPYLFDCDSRDAETNWETTEAEWVHPTEILRRETVPNLWASYSRVAPTIQQIAEDSEHGSASISVRALEVLRDRAGSVAERGQRVVTRERDPDEWSNLTLLAEKLRSARPGMAVVANRVNRVMANASAGQTPKAVEQAAREGIERAFQVDEQAAENAVTRIQDAAVLTLSHSGTVLEALPAAERVFVAESRPANEGVGVAETLAGETNDAESKRKDDPSVTLHTDAAVSHVLATEDVDAILVGADAILPDGRVVNKTGTRGAALAAAREEIPVYAVAASDKVQTAAEVHLEEGDAESVYDGEADVTVSNPTFDVTPADLVSGVISERGVLDVADVRAVAEELQELSAWQE